MNLLNKINELINEITIEKLSSISGENKLKVEENIKACITTILYSLINKKSEELDSILQISEHIVSETYNGQNYSVLLKTIFGDNLESVLFEIAQANNSKIETLHLIANSTVFCICKAIGYYVSDFELTNTKNLLNINKDDINSLLPSYITKSMLEQPTTFDLIINPFQAAGA